MAIMNNIEHLQKNLEEEKNVVIGELKGVGVIKDKRNPDDWQATPGKLDIQESDPNEVGDRIESYEENTALVHELEGRLTEIDKALANIKADTYGMCEVGGEPIEEDRLEANPAAATCKKHME